MIAAVIARQTVRWGNVLNLPQRSNAGATDRSNKDAPAQTYAIPAAPVEIDAFGNLSRDRALRARSYLESITKQAE